MCSKGSRIYCINSQHDTSNWEAGNKSWWRRMSSVGIIHIAALQRSTLEKLPRLQTLDGLPGSLWKRITFWKCLTYKRPIIELVLWSWFAVTVDEAESRRLMVWSVLVSWCSFCVGEPKGKRWRSYHDVHEEVLPPSKGNSAGGALHQRWNPFANLRNILRWDSWFLLNSSEITSRLHLRGWWHQKMRVIRSFSLPSSA